MSISPALNRTDSEDVAALREYLRFYYGQYLEKTEDLSQKACCTDETAARHADALLIDEALAG